jgi:hypothetical protein
MPGLFRPYSLLLLAQLASCLDVQMALTPSAPAPFISQSFVSLSIEQDLWTDWVGTTSRNQFFFNTLNNLLQLTGMPPQIRIGGNSEDRTNFSNVSTLSCGAQILNNYSCQFSEAIFPPVTATVPYPEATNITVGDSYYATAQFLPPSMDFLKSLSLSLSLSLTQLHFSIDTDTRVIWGLNLGQNNITAAFFEAQSLIKAFASSPFKNAGIVLEAIEIGNEADLYSENGMRPSTFTSKEYVTECVLDDLVVS